MTTTAAFAQQKQMAISSITSPINVMSPAPSISSFYFSDQHSMYQRNYDHRAHHYSNGVVNVNLASLEHFSPISDPDRLHTDHERESFSLSSPESNDMERSSFLIVSSKRDNQESSGDENIASCMNDILVPALSSSSTSSLSTSPSPCNDNTGTLSLQERRQRNKTASAKYRAKKNQQHHEMRSVINSLTKENDVLLRQLEQVKVENKQLKSVCDKLRSKIMAEKMLKKMLQQKGQTGRSELQTPPLMPLMDEDDCDSDSIHSDEKHVSNDSKHV